MPLQYLSVTIPAGEVFSSAVDCGGSPVVRLVMPDAWTGNAPLTIQLSPDGVAWANLHHVVFVQSVATMRDAAGYLPWEVVIPSVILGAIVPLPPGTGEALAWVRFRSGTTAAPVIQTADRTFYLMLDAPAPARAA